MYWLNMLETISISASAAAIFSAEVGWGRAPPPKRKDILVEWLVLWAVMLVSVRVESWTLLLCVQRTGVSMPARLKCYFRFERSAFSTCSSLNLTSLIARTHPDKYHLPYQFKCRGYLH